jgi:hypothetical protein
VMKASDQKGSLTPVKGKRNGRIVWETLRLQCNSKHSDCSSWSGWQKVSKPIRPIRKKFLLCRNWQVPVDPHPMLTHWLGNFRRSIGSSWILWYTKSSTSYRILRTVCQRVVSLKRELSRNCWDWHNHYKRKIKPHKLFLFIGDVIIYFILLFTVYYSKILLMISQ